MFYGIGLGLNGDALCCLPRSLSKPFSFYQLVCWQSELPDEDVSAAHWHHNLPQLRAASKRSIFYCLRDALNRIDSMPDLQKAATPMHSTEAGISICRREIQRLKAASPMASRPSGNVTLESRLHFLNARLSMLVAPPLTLYAVMSDKALMITMPFLTF